MSKDKKSKVINKVGRPSEYDFKLCIEICDLVANGMNVITALESDDRFPTWTAFRKWKQKNNELNTLYIKSLQDKAIYCEYVIDTYKQMLLSEKIDASTYNTLTQTEKWKMCKFYPKMFGDKIDMTTDGESINKNPITINLEVANAKKK